MEEELMKRLSYSKCDCPIDYRKEIGIINGVCPKHDKSVLLVDGIEASKIRKLTKSDSK